jgi:hypothetical protein
VHQGTQATRAFHELFGQVEAFVADPGTVDLRVVPGGDPIDHAVLLFAQGAQLPVVGAFPDVDAAAPGAAGADGGNRLQVPDTALVEEVPGEERSHGADGGDVVRVGVVEGPLLQALDPRVAAPLDNAQLVGAGDFAGEAHAAAAEDAALGVVDDPLGEVVELGLVVLGIDVERLIRPVLHLVFLQPALAGLVADAAVHRMIQGDELHDGTPGGTNRFAVRFDLHSRSDGQVAGRHEFGTAVDLHQADAAVTGDGEAGVKAEMGDVDAASQGCFQYGFAFLRLDDLVVDL